MSERDRMLMEDQLAHALDALVLGMPHRAAGDASLTRLAASIQGIGVTGNEAAPAPPLDRAAKTRIWSELMREHSGAADRAVSQVPGAAGSALSLNPWAEEQTAEPPKRPRSSSGVLRFVPAAQPASSFMLTIAVLVLIGGAFASLAPDGGRGIFPSVQATEDPAQLAVATPRASPDAGFDYLVPTTLEDCTVDSRPIEQIWALYDDPGEQVEREYAPTQVADTPLTIEIADAARIWWACSAYGYPSQRLAMESPRNIYESGPNYLPGWDVEMEEVWRTGTQLLADEVLDGEWESFYVETAQMGDIEAGTAVYTFQNQRSFVLPQHVYQLPDGSVGGLVTQLVPLGYIESMSVSPDHSVEFQIFAPDPTQDDRWVLDETIWLCATGCDELIDDPALEVPAVNTAVDSCAATRIHTEQWLDAPAGSALRTAPWVSVQSTGIRAAGHLLYGDRPLPIDGMFTDSGAIAETIWTFDRPVGGLTLTASNLDNPSAAAVHIPIEPTNPHVAYWSEWSSNLALPAPGCWQLTLITTDISGTLVHGTVVVSVEGESNDAVATPEA